MSAESPLDKRCQRTPERNESEGRAVSTSAQIEAANEAVRRAKENADEFHNAIFVRDSDGDAWLRIGPDEWCLATDAIKGEKYAQRYSSSLNEVMADGYGPLEVEWRYEG